MSGIGTFDDFFSGDDFTIDPEVMEAERDSTSEDWDTGIVPDVFASGEKQDIFSTKA